MELDDLKFNWQRETKQNLDINKQSMEQLQLILKEKTTGTLTGLKKKYERIISFILLGLFLNILLNPFLHFLLGDEGPVFRLTFGGLLSLITIVSLGLIVVFFYWLKYTGLKTVLTTNDLKESLDKNIVQLKKSLRQEIFFILALFLVVFVLGRITSQYLGNGDFWDVLHTDILLALIAGLSLMGFYIYKRVKAYTKNIGKLQQYLDELKDGAKNDCH